MMSLRRIFGLMLLFFFFEAVVAVVTTFAYPNVNVFLACVAMTGLAVGVWGAFALVTRVLSRPRAPQPAPLAKASPVAPRRPFGDDIFSQELGLLVTEANRRLVGTLPPNQRGEQPTVATLPLYLVIGGEGSGKTSAILNSGLEPRLLAGEATRDGNVIPTRLCNLWFAEGAVFADISGRVLTQETENWERALRFFSQPTRIPRWKQILLGRRSRSNLKGMVLVCDTSQFARSNDPQRMAAFARTLGDRLQVAGTVLQREFPVYVVFSKCDGIQYFPEFFAHLSEPEGRRLLGATLPSLKVRNDSADIYADREGKRLIEYFNRLYMSLAEKRLVFLAREDDAAKKSTAYEFPRELKKLRGDVVQFLLDVFRPNPLQAGPRLRGFYLSGQRWVARNLIPAADATMGGFTVVPKRADATVFFGASAQPGPARPVAVSSGIAKWVFLTDLFHNVILKDREGYVAPPVNPRDRDYRNIAFAGAGALLLLLCLLWANSWRRNRDLLNDVQGAAQHVHMYRADSTSIGDALADLDTLRTPLATLLQYERHGAPLSYRWGLYAGHDATESLSDLYFDRFRKLFMDPTLTSLTSRFLQLDPTAPVRDNIYDLLKAYRMVTSGECKPDAQFLSNSLLPIWSNIVSISPSDDGALADRQIQFYISELLIRNPYEQTIPENNKALAIARNYLRELNGPDKIFRALVERLNRSHQGDALSSYAPNFGEVLTGPNMVDAAYTHDGWIAMMDNIRQHKIDSADEPCVVGKQSDNSASSFTGENERAITALYVDNYIQRWRLFVGAHHVEPFRGSGDAAQKLRVLADNNRSPLLELVYMTSHNTDLVAAQPESSVQAITEAGKGVLDKLASKLGKTSTNAARSAENSLGSNLGPNANDVTNAFRPIWVVADPAHPDKLLNSVNQPYVQALEELGNSLAALPARNDPKDPVNQEAFNRANKAYEGAMTAHHTLGAAISSTTSGVDIDLKALLLEPISYGGRIIKGTPLVPPPPPPPDMTIPIRTHVNQAAQALCQNVDLLRSKYPFDPNATQEATIQDLNGVFAPGTASLAQFSQVPDVSKAFLRQGQAWIPNPSFPGTPSQSFLASLNDFVGFSNAFYPDATGNPHFDYTLTLDGTGRVPIELDVDGHILRYNPKKGPVSQKLVWPPTTNAPTTLIVHAGMPLRIQNLGQWSLFHLLQAADKQVGGLFVFSTVQLSNGNKSLLQDNKGHPVTIEIRIDSTAVNAFGRSYFGKLRCDNFAGWALR
jgi:type VI secretion system protein ImpL